MVRNLRTIRTLGKETYMESRYDGALGESYRAIEGTNFCDALYSPVILTVNAVVMGAVMLLSASGNPAVLTLFGMTAGTAVTVMNYVSQIFSPLESLGMELQTIQSAVAGVHRINDFLAQPEQEPAAPETENPAAPMVELRDVDFGYEAGQNVPHHLNMEQRFHPVPGTVRDQITLYDDAITEEQIRRAVELAGLTEAIDALPQGCAPPAPRTFSLRDSGSCCPSPGRWRRIPNCCCWTRSPPIWTRRRNGRCCGP